MHARGNTYSQRGVEKPRKVPLTNRSQEEKERHQVEPRPHSAHPLEVPVKAVGSSW